MKNNINELLQAVRGLEVIAIGAVMGIASHLLNDDKHTFLGFIRAIFLSGTSAFLLFLLIGDIESITEGQKSFGYGVAGLTGEILLRGIIDLSKKFVKNPKDTIKSIKSNIWK